MREEAWQAARSPQRGEAPAIGYLAAMKNRVLLGSALAAALAFPGILHAQADTTAPAGGQPAPAAVSQDGQYVRQSVSHLGILWKRGAGRSVSGSHAAYILEQMDADFRLPRFDDNPLPPELVAEFSRAAGSGDLSGQELSKSIGEVLAPRILSDVSKRSVERAATLRSEFQLNSMVAEKTKTVDVTGEQVTAVMNSAWLYVPVLEDVSVGDGPQSASAQVSMSLLWFHIRTDSLGRPKAELAHELKASGFMLSLQGRGSLGGGPARFCLQSAARSCVKSLLRQTKDIPEFSLSGQVQESGLQTVRLDLGAGQAPRSNERYALLENQETKDGRLEVKELGWVRVSGAPDTVAHRLAGARIVSGSPYTGMVLREIPLSSWSLEGGYRREPAVLEADGSSYAGDLQGFRIGGWYDPDFWYGFAAGIGVEWIWGSLARGGDATSYDQSSLGLHLGLRQSLPLYRRLSLYVQPEVSLRRLYTAASDVPAASLETDVLGAGIQGGLELALFPSLDLRAGMGWNALDADLGTVEEESPAAALKSDGPTLSVQMQWTPAALSVNPLDFVLGLMGI